MKEVSLYVVPTRSACARFNNKYLDALEGEEIKLKARHFHATQKKFKPFIEKKEGAIGLTNGQLGELVNIIYTKDGGVDKLIVKLQRGIQE